METYRTDPFTAADLVVQPSLLPVDDELFAAPPRSAAKPTEQLTRTKCYVCERNYVATMASAKLCGLCLEDLDQTRTYVARCVDAVLARMDVAQATWEQQRTTSPARDRWLKVEEAMIAVAEKKIPQASLDATWAKRKAEGGALAALLSAYEVYALDTDQCGVELNRWHRAQTEINAAFLATEV